MPKRIVGAILLLGLALACAGQDKQKKTYELIYDDVQALKDQVQELRARLDRTAEDLRAIGAQLKILADLVRQSLADQVALKESVQVVPAQYQDVLLRAELQLAIKTNQGTWEELIRVLLRRGSARVS